MPTTSNKPTRAALSERDDSGFQAIGGDMLRLELPDRFLEFGASGYEENGNWAWGSPDAWC
jgi:hypothetical protein